MERRRLECQLRDFAATDVGNKELRQNFTGVLTSQISQVSFTEKQIGSNLTAYDFFYSDGGDQEFAVSPIAPYQTFNVTAQLAAGRSLAVFPYSVTRRAEHTSMMSSSRPIRPRFPRQAPLFPSLPPLFWLGGLAVLRRKEPVGSSIAACVRLASSAASTGSG